LERPPRGGLSVCTEWLLECPLMWVSPLFMTTPKKVHSVTITVEPHGGFKVSCYGRALFVHRCSPWRTSPSLTVSQLFLERSLASTI
jgi:hypothetical protein